MSPSYLRSRFAGKVRRLPAVPEVKFDGSFFRMVKKDLRKSQGFAGGVSPGAATGGLFLPPKGAVLPKNEKNREKSGNLPIGCLTRRLLPKV
jgi:hypothetical protein